MATAETQKGPVEDPEPLLARWSGQLDDLIRQVETWARELDWATRRIEKSMEDSKIGKYKAPALLIQKETVRVLLDPIARATPGSEGVVDLYLMPAYDDLASLYYYDGGWQLHYMAPGSPLVATIRDAEHRPLSKDSLRGVLDAMTEDAS
jgi:hypothetical protein